MSGSFLQTFKARFIKATYFNTKKRVEFFRVLKSMTQNGISIQATLSYYAEMVQKYDRKNRNMAFVLTDVLKKMKQGQPFEQAVMFWVPTQERVLLEASARDIPRATDVITKYTENTLSIQNALVSALTYPVMMLLILIAALGAFTFYIIPTMTKISPPSSWPGSAKALYSFTNFIHVNVISIGIILFVVLVFSSWSFQNFKFMPARRLLDKIPPWNIYKRYTATSFLIALASMLKSGASLNYALINIRTNSVGYLNAYVTAMLRKLTKGGDFGEALSIDLFSGPVLISLTVFALTNKLEQGIQFLADENLEEQRQGFIAQGKILGYVMMFLVAGVVGWVMLAFYGMQGSVQQG